MASTLPEAASVCRVCGKALAEGQAVCSACGAAHGEENRCPHCNAVADVAAHAALGFRCLVCGGPRIALTGRVGPLGAAVKQALEAAGREQTKHLMLTAAGLLLGAMGALGLVVAGVALVAASPGLLPSIAALLGAGLPFVAGLVALARAAQARTLRGQALHAARLAALSDVQSATGALDAASAARLLRIDTEQAELLLAEASVAALLEAGPTPRLRVEPTTPSAAEEPALEPAPSAERQRGPTEI